VIWIIRLGLLAVIIFGVIYLLKQKKRQEEGMEDLQTERDLVGELSERWYIEKGIPIKVDYDEKTKIFTTRVLNTSISAEDPVVYISFVECLKALDETYTKLYIKKLSGEEFTEQEEKDFEYLSERIKDNPGLEEIVEILEICRKSWSKALLEQLKHTNYDAKALKETLEQDIETSIFEIREDLKDVLFDVAARIRKISREQDRVVFERSIERITKEENE